MKVRLRLFDPPVGSFFLFGPRGTGKSTGMQHQFKEALRLDLLQPDTLRTFVARPERLRELVLQQPDAATIIVDEVQKAPALLDVVHALIEEHRGWRFVLTGSSARKLERSGVDLMAGRAAWRTLHPYMAAELGSDFDLPLALQRGMLPIVFEASEPTEVLASYMGLYLREEVQTEGLVRNLGDFSRFLEAVSFSHAQALNISNVARECQVQRTTVAAYVQILEDLLLAFQVPVFNRRAGRAVTSRPKFYYFDTGAFRSLRPRGPLDHPGEIDGSALEGLVAQHLRAWIDYGNSDCKLHFWRTRPGSEVDFVLYGEDGFWAIEVKNAATVRKADLRSLRAFRDDYPECRPVLLYRGEHALRFHDVVCLPCDKFLVNLVPGKPLLPW